MFSRKVREVKWALAPVPEGLSPRARAKREQILESAQRLFVQNGFAGTSTDAIAAESGVSKRTLYAYYPTKEKFFADVLRHLTIENPQTTVLDSMNEMSPQSHEELRQYLIYLAERVVTTMMRPDYLALLRTIIADTHRFPQLGTLYRSTVPEQGFRLTRSLLGRARETGLVGDVSEEAATRMLLGSLVTYVLFEGLFVADAPPQPPTRNEIEQIVDLFTKAIA